MLVYTGVGGSGRPPQPPPNVVGLVVAAAPPDHRATGQSDVIPETYRTAGALQKPVERRLPMPMYYPTAPQKRPLKRPAKLQ